MKKFSLIFLSIFVLFGFSNAWAEGEKMMKDGVEASKTMVTGGDGAKPEVKEGEGDVKSESDSSDGDPKPEETNVDDKK